MDLLMVQPEPIYGNAGAPPSSGAYFAEYFWGEKNLGFNVLYHNMKHGQVSVKDLQDFVRESANVEESYAKNMTKLAHKAANYNQLGSFFPLMDVFKVMSEKISSCHMDIVLKLQDIIKDLSKYMDEQKLKHKHSKDTFSGTADALQHLHTATNAVTKSKEKYNQICMEEERLKATGTAQQKELEKASSKSKKASEEYKSQVGKHAIARHQFEEKMYKTALEFQKIEKEHLDHMKSVLDAYILSFENAHVLVNQVHQEFRRQLDVKSADYLLQLYSEQKSTGTERPATILFEEFKPDNTSTGTGSLTPTPVVENGTPNHGNLSDSSSQTGATQPPPNKKKETSSFFRIPRRKGRQKNDLSTHSSSSKDSKDAESIDSPEKEPELQIDDEGYTIRPDSPVRSEKNSFQFSSDSDSDSDSDDATRRKIQVRIKPKEESQATSSGSDNMDALNALARNLTLTTPSPVIAAKQFDIQDPVKHNSDSVGLSNQMMNSDKMSNSELMQLFGNSKSSVSHVKTTRASSLGSNSDKPKDELDLFSNFDTSKLARPRSSMKESNKISVKKGPAPPIPMSIAQSESSKSLDEMLGADNTSDINPDVPPPRPPKPSGPASTLIPQARPTNLSVENIAKFENSEFTQHRSNSAPLVSSESWSSLSSSGGGGTPTHQPVENSVPGFSSVSRGPSPLTLSHSDNIPIAIAFIETVNAYFKENDPSKTLIKITGEMQVSFPAGITRAFTTNLNPPILSFKIGCPSHKSLSNVSHDTKLLKREQTFDEGSTYAFSFDMPTLISRVKQMTEKDPNSPHYNIHIVSYVVPSSHQTLPLHVSCLWQCEPTTTDITINYDYNSSAASCTLQSLNVIVPVHGSVNDVQSTPQTIWNSAQNRLCWQIPAKISKENPSGTLKSTLTMASGPSKPSALAVQFFSDGNTLSGADFELSGTGYRVSLVKKRFVTGKYLCENS